MPLILPVKPGLTSYAVGSIPEKWDKQWFKYFIDAFLTNADIRNATTGSGITISGNVSGNSTNPTTGQPSNSGVVISQSPIPNDTVLGNVSGVTAAPVGLNQTQLTALINQFTAVLAGDVPASGGGTLNYLRADGQWTAPAGSTAIPNNTVLGNVSGASAVPVALTQAQLTTLVNVFSATLSGAVPASGGGTTTFLRADGTFATIAVPAAANPTAQVGPTAVNGVATTYMRSDAAPAINLGAAYTWTGVHTFSARPAANLGLTVAGGTFVSRGISDSATATALTINSSGGVVIAAATGTTSLQVTSSSGNANIVAIGATNDAARIVLTDGNTGTRSFQVRAGGAGTGIFDIFDATGSASRLQISTTGAVSILTPTSGTALTINGTNAAIPFIIASGFASTFASAEISIRRAGSVANNVSQGPNISLGDTTATSASVIQQSGGQTELWQTLNNGVNWTQVWATANVGGLFVRAPTSGTLALGVAGDISVSARIYTYNGGVAAGSGVATSLQALPNTGYGSYLVSAAISGANDATNYSAASIVAMNGSVAKITSLQTAGLLTITLSGTTVQATQNSGAGATISFSIIRIA